MQISCTQKKHVHQEVDEFIEEVLEHPLDCRQKDQVQLVGFRANIQFFFFFFEITDLIYVMSIILLF